jgi:protein-tyrosine kinase
VNTVSKRRSRAPSDDDGVRRPLGLQLREAGKLSDQDIARILAVQNEHQLRFGEAAVELGLLTERELQTALAHQFRYPCSVGEQVRLDPHLFTVRDPFGEQSEALRTLRSQLLLRWFTDRRKTLVVTSVRCGEGSHALAANLAIVFAQLGERTLLIDANLRFPTQRSLFRLPAASPGLSCMLSGRCDAEAVMSPLPGFETLTVVCAGAPPPNPQELLSRVPFSYLVETAPALFDIVIIDTPPILEFADAQLVTALVGGCLLATRRHHTRLHDVEDVKRRLDGCGAGIVGAVICD